MRCCANALFRAVPHHYGGPSILPGDGHCFGDGAPCGVCRPRRRRGDPPTVRRRCDGRRATPHARRRGCAPCARPPGGGRAAWVVGCTLPPDCLVRGRPACAAWPPTRQRTPRARLQVFADAARDQSVIFEIVVRVDLHGKERRRGSGMRPGTNALCTPPHFDALLTRPPRTPSQPLPGTPGGCP